MMMSIRRDTWGGFVQYQDHIRYVVDGGIAGMRRQTVNKSTQ